jgi:acyl dehydratase
MAIDPSLVGRSYPPQPYEVSREKIREFADAIGDANPIYTSYAAAAEFGHADVAAPPTFVTIPVMRGCNTILAELKIELARVVHVEQTFASQRAVVAGDRLSTTSTVEAVRRMVGNDVLTIRNEVRDHHGADVCVATSTLLVRPEEQPDAV